MSIFSDAIGDYQDEVECWARRRWTLPPYKSKAFFEHLDREQMSVEDVQATVMYVHALQTGAIVGDEWTGGEVYVGNWDEGLPVDQQALWIVRRAEDELQALQSDTVERAGRQLFDAELGGMLLAYFDAQAEPVFDPEDLALGRASKVPGAAEARDQELLWAAALRHIGGRFARIILSAPVPRFYVRPGASGAYLPDRAAIVIPSAEEHPDQFQRAVYRYLVEHGVAWRIVPVVRNRDAYDAPLVRVVGGGYALPGPWVDASDGLLQAAQSSEMDALVEGARPVTEASIRALAGGFEYLLGVAARCVAQNAVGLAATWMRSPAQVALYYALSMGSFVAGAEDGG